MNEENVRNKIIALSGEPVSGKGTTVKRIIEKLKQQGYTEEQIHLESTGNDFRRYFNSLIDLITNLDNKEKLDEIHERKELRDFFGNEEYRKILAQTIVKLKQKNIDLTHFTINEANNSEEFKEVRKIVDTLIDEGMANKGKEINSESHPEEIWIIDSRLAFHNIPEAFSVRLTTNADVAGERLFNDNSRGKEDKYSNVEEAKKEREMRRIGENERYKKRYGVDLTDDGNYDLIIDTSYSTVEDIANTILQCSEYYEKGKDFSKKWASPKTLLPSQNELQTLGTSSQTGLNFQDMLDSISKNGYLLNSGIRVVKVDNMNYISDGHHRNFAAAYLGKTLVPYEVIEKYDELHNTERKPKIRTTIGMLVGHEWLIEKGDTKPFSYKNMYPQFWEKLEKDREMSID